MEKTSNFFKNIHTVKYLELMPNFKEKKTQAFTTIALTLISLSIFGFFAINPTLSTIGKLKRELSDSEFVNKKLEQKIINLGILQNKYNLLQNDIPFPIRAIPQNPSVPTLIGQIQSLAIENNVTIKRIQAFQVELGSKSKKPDKNASFNFSLQAQGGYDNLSSFISSLVNFERIVTLDAISLNTDKTKSGAIELNLRGKGYFKK